MGIEETRILSAMPGSWPGGKGLERRKHEPMEFRISNLGFRIVFNPKSAIREANGPLIEGELSFVGVIHDQSGGEGCKFDQLA